MTPYRLIFQRSRRPLNILAISIFVSLTFAIGSIYVRDSLKTSIANDEAQLAARRSILTTKKLDLQTIQTHIAKFQSLKQQGLVGSADREGWVEQLTANRIQRISGGTLAYTLKPPQALTNAATLEFDPTGTAVVNPDAPTTHDLEFQLKGIHEAELLDMLQDYRNSVHGRFRVQSCRFGDANQDGLLVQCTLRFFTVPEAKKAPGV